MSVDTHEVTAEETETTSKIITEARKRPATVADLLAKKMREDTFSVPLTTPDGEELELTLRYRAIPSKAYDDLVAKFPPTKDQQKQGLVYDIDRFAPALISACSVEPQISVEEAAELYNSDNWSAGEIADLFVRAQRLCNAGLDVSFSAAG